MISKSMTVKIGSRKNILWASGTALLAGCFLWAPGALRAQEQPASPPPQQQHSSDDSGRPPSFGQQLTRETREAAGEDKEEKDKAGFKVSGSVRFVAKKLGISPETASLLSFLFNFGVIAGIFIWVTRKYLPGAFHARTAAIQKAIKEAQKASEEARQRLAEIESRLGKLDTEIGAMRDAAEKEAAAEEVRIRAAAEEDARKILEAAQQEIASAIKTARRELTAYAADLAIGLAKRQIHIDAATDQALVQNFASQLVPPSGSPPKTQGKGRQ
jgi:F-type H+-transporting ATPase subunit b